MLLPLLLLAYLASTVVGSSLTTVLTSYAELASLNAQLGQLPIFTAFLENLTDVTILAPSNDALATFFSSPAGIAASNNPAALEAVLQYHIQSGMWYQQTGSAPTAGEEAGHWTRTLLTSPSETNVTGGQFLEGVLDMTGTGLFYSGLGDTSKVITPNINITSGLLHIIDTVLTIPERISTTAVAAGLNAAVGAFTVADSLNVLDYTKDVTAFIPTNDAFESVGSTLESMTTIQLAEIMDYHMISGKYPNFYIGAKGWTFGANATLTMINGENITITTASDGTTYVNDAKIITPNLLVANGVVHVIDSVLNPANASLTPDLTAPTQAPAFGSATPLSGSAVPFTSAVTVPSATSTASASSGSNSKPEHTGLSTGAKVGIAIGVAVTAVSTIALVMLCDGIPIFHKLVRGSGKGARSERCAHCNKWHDAKACERSLDLEKSGSKTPKLSPSERASTAELDSSPVEKPEVDSKSIQEADSSPVTGHELDSTPVGPELDSRSNWPLEIDGRAVWPKEKDASLFGQWSQPQS